METEALIELTTEIVTAHVGHNSVAADDLPRLIRSVYDALAGVGQHAPVAEEKREPAVSVRSSVKPDTIACLECGARMKMLKRHLATDHGTTPAEYRRRWDLAADYPMVAPNYSTTRKELAKKIGLGRKPGTKVAAGKSRSKSARRKAKAAPEAEAQG